jgi:hypothetical protein
MANRMTFLLLVSFAMGMFFAQSARADFEDVPRDHWAYGAVSYLEQNGLVTGYPDGTFQGDRVLTRYEFAMVVSRLYDEFTTKLKQTPGPPPVDQQGVLQMLIEEFKPDIDKLKDLVDIDTARIGVVEKTTDQLSTRMSDITTKVTNIGANSNSFNTSGDLRLRFEGIYPNTGLQTQRPRYRLRWGFTQSIGDELKFGARVASGSLWASTSTNQTFEHNFGVANINIDRAYMQYSPKSTPGLVMWAGKFAPPWKNGPLVWDSDVNVEGAAEQYTHGDLQATLGELVPTTKGFYIVAQAGATKIGNTGLSAFVTYHFINQDAWEMIKANMAIKDKSDPFFLKSNWDFTRLDDPKDYRAIEGYLQWKNTMGGIPVAITANYLRNLDSVAKPAEGEAAKSGLLQAADLELAIYNPPANVGDWQAKAEYGRAQANSVLTWLADADRGGSDYKFWVGSWTYRLMKNTDFAVTYINRSRLTKDSSDQIVQVDISTKF